jgi:uncharacterized protein
MSGSTDLTEMLRTLTPVVREGEYVYTVLTTIESATVPLFATVVEDEGVTGVVRRDDADRVGYAYDFVAAWITLEVHSSLEAVGLTAAFSAALGAAGISCNVLAGFHHDHILVPIGDRDRAVDALLALRDASR